MPAVKMRRLHGRAVAAARPHSSCTATLLQPPASEERRATCQVASGLQTSKNGCDIHSSGQQEVDDGLCESQAAQGRRSAQIS